LVEKQRVRIGELTATAPGGKSNLGRRGEDGIGGRERFYKLKLGNVMVGMLVDWRVKVARSFDKWREVSGR